MSSQNLSLRGVASLLISLGLMMGACSSDSLDDRQGSSPDSGMVDEGNLQNDIGLGEDVSQDVADDITTPSDMGEGELDITEADMSPPPDMPDDSMDVGEEDINLDVTPDMAFEGITTGLCEGVDPATPEGFIRLEGGTFRMGDDRSFQEATLTNPFFIQQTEVTQAQWLEVIGTEAFEHTECGEECPVNNISWFGAVAYANKLSELEGLPRCYTDNGFVVGDDIYSCCGYRLPTEAEWEYAARAGTTTNTYLGDLTEEDEECGEPQLRSIAWYRCNTDGSPQPVKMRQPNSWGLFDMLGNVWEWTNDAYDFYGGDAVTNPSGAESPSLSDNRMLRGGAYNSRADFVHVNYRSDRDPEARRNNYGFRVVRSVP